MALKYLPARGSILICNYSTGFKPPEMVKDRLVVVMSPKLPMRDNLCAVVPLSTTPPRAGVRYQCRVEMPESPPRPFPGYFKFAKADMIATVSCERLSFPRIGKDPETGQRIYYKHLLAADQMELIEDAILISLGLEHLTTRR